MPDPRKDYEQLLEDESRANVGAGNGTHDYVNRPGVMIEPVAPRERSNLQGAIVVTNLVGLALAVVIAVETRATVALALAAVLLLSTTLLVFAQIRAPRRSVRAGNSA